MKFKFTLLAFITLSIQAWSQSKNNISVVYGTASSFVNIHGAIGDYGYHNETGTVYGLTYSKKFSRNFSIETGLLFSSDKVELSSIQPPRGDVISDGNVKLLSVPVTFKFAFLRYFYFDVGLSVDKQTDYTNNSVVVDQSGIGGELGIGAKYTFSQVTIFINPYLRQCGVISFAGASNNNLTDAGIKFGLGYNF